METSDGIGKAVDAAERALRTGDAHDALRASVAAIQRALAARGPFLPPAAAAQFARRAAALERALRVGESVFIPSIAADSAAIGQVASASCAIQPPSAPNAGAGDSLSLADRSGEEVTCDRALKTAVLTNMRNCTILLSAVSGAVFLRGVSNSTVTVSAAQVRLRDCHAVRVVCAVVATPPVLEACSGVVFERRANVHSGEQLAAAGLGASADCSHCPMDFDADL